MYFVVDSTGSSETSSTRRPNLPSTSRQRCRCSTSEQNTSDGATTAPDGCVYAPSLKALSVAARAAEGGVCGGMYGRSWSMKERTCSTSSLVTPKRDSICACGEARRDEPEGRAGGEAEAGGRLHGGGVADVAPQRVVRHAGGGERGGSLLERGVREVDAHHRERVGGEVLAAQRVVCRGSGGEWCGTRRCRRGARGAYSSRSRRWCPARCRRHTPCPPLRVAGSTPATSSLKLFEAPRANVQHANCTLPTVFQPLLDVQWHRLHFLMTLPLHLHSRTGSMLKIFCTCTVIMSWKYRLCMKPEPTTLSTRSTCSSLPSSSCANTSPGEPNSASSSR